MSQQEFVPQDQQSEDEENTYVPLSPYSWSGNSSSGAEPRDEPPSSYEYEAGYQAQDSFTQNSHDANSPFDAANAYTPASQQVQQEQYQQYQNPYESDSSGQAYDPYNNYKAAQNNAYQNVPSYARPQSQSFNPWRFSSILLILVVIGFLSMLGHGFFFFGGGWVFGGFFPIFILLMIFSSFRRGGRRRYRRGPWGW